MKDNSKKRLQMFIAVAYGLTALMTIFMFIGLKTGKDLTAFVTAQMTYPAIGVMLGSLLFGDKEKKLPKAGFIAFIITGAVLAVLSIVSIFMPQTMVTIAGSEITNWNLYGQYVVMAGSIVTYILFWVCGKEKRRNAGLSRNKILLSIAFVALFTLLYFARILVSVSVSQVILHTEGGGISEVIGIVASQSFLINVINTMINFPFTFLIFMGEEYGWRYYLQPVLQKKFGLRKGVLILGVVWALWHTGIVFTFYSPTSGLQYLVGQFITCTALGIFFGLAYMKTQNIWALTMMHFINNNFIVLLSGGDMNVLQGQEVSWAQVPVMIIQSLVFAVFILAPAYNKKKHEDAEELKVAG